MATGRKGATRESPSPVDQMEIAEAEETEGQKYPTLKMADLEDVEVLESVQRLAGISLVSLSEEESPGGTDATVGQPTGTPSTDWWLVGEASSSNDKRGEAPKRKAASKSNKVTVPLKKPKGETATVGQPTGSESQESISEALKQIEDKTSQLHLILQLHKIATKDELAAIENKKTWLSEYCIKGTKPHHFRIDVLLDGIAPTKNTFLSQYVLKL